MSTYKKKIAGASTYHEANVTCDEADIWVEGCSTAIFGNFNCSGTCKIHVEGWSTLRIDKGNIACAKGDIEGMSTGICTAKIGDDQVTPSGGSTWRT